LERTVNIHWPDKIAKTENQQELVLNQFRRRKWNWLGHGDKK